jgi:hypothetical protein
MTCRAPEGKCYTYPGKYVRGDSNGKQEQNLVLARGADGCFDGSLHSLMKYFTLGKQKLSVCIIIAI